MKCPGGTGDSSKKNKRIPLEECDDEVFVPVCHESDIKIMNTEIVIFLKETMTMHNYF